MSSWWAARSSALIWNGESIRRTKGRDGGGEAESVEVLVRCATRRRGAYLRLGHAQALERRARAQCARPLALHFHAIIHIFENSRELTRRRRKMGPSCVKRCTTSERTTVA